MNRTLKKLYGDFITVKNYLEVKKRILNLPKETVYDPSKEMDLDVYGDLRTAKKIVILSHTFSGNSDHFINVYLAERFHLHGYTVVAFNSPGFRNIITDEPYTGEIKSQIKLGYIFDNIIDFIRKENQDAPIIASAFSAGGGGLLNHFATNKRDISGITVIAPSYYTPRNVGYLHMPTTIDLSRMYARNFLRTRKYKKIVKLLGVGLDARRLYRVNNNEKTGIQRNNLTNTPIIGLHCTDDTINSIEDARTFFKRMNSPAAKLIEFSGQGHSLTYTMVGTCIEQSDILCEEWAKAKND